MNFKRMKKVFICMGAVTVISILNTYAEDEKPQLSLKITAEKEVAVKEKDKKITKMVPADEINKKDVVLYTINFKNEGQTLIKNAVIVDPIPQGMVCLPVSVSSDNAHIAFSIDNLATFQAPPAKYKVKKADGSEEEKIAPAEMITHIKWQLKEKLEPGKGGIVTFKAKLR